MSLFDRLKTKLGKTRGSVVGRLQQSISRSPSISEDLIDEIEELLITSDVGVDTSLALIEGVRSRVKSDKISDSSRIKDLLRDEMKTLVSKGAAGGNGGDFFADNRRPYVVMLVGVNGTGKTTTLGKLAAQFTQANKTVLLAASDTFRAAATEQLEIWAKRSQSHIIGQQPGADPAAVAYDAINAAFAREVDVVLIDTAGRLHTKVNLMEELKKVSRAVSKLIPDAPHETLLVLDATTGQNARRQVEEFGKALRLTGIVLTKLDGTAKGGVVVGIMNEFDIPVKFIGLGEQLDDLLPFNASDFIDALFES